MNVRKLALELLLTINYRQGFSTELIRENSYKLDSSRDESFLRELVYGVIENQIYLDHMIKKASKVPLKKIQPEILEILRMGVFQLLFLGTPGHAAINESVKLSKKYAFRGIDRFVNGVLRAVDRNRDEFSVVEETEPLLRLSTTYSHPRELVAYFVDYLGIEGTEALLKENNRKAPMTVRVNTLKTTREKLMARLKDEGFDVLKSTIAVDGIIVNNPVRLTASGAFIDGECIIQDTGSIFVGEILDPEPGTAVLDLCAAPGGKTTHLAQLMEDCGSLVANDVIAGKLRLIEENCARLGITSVTTHQGDGLILQNEWVGAFDCVLLDAPCTGLGLIRRKPEIRYRIDREGIEAQAKKQKQLLEIALSYVKPGGYLVYSTCSIGPVENKMVREWFLDHHDNVAPVMIQGKPFIELFPHVDGTDGFFMCKFSVSGSEKS